MNKMKKIKKIQIKKIIENINDQKYAVIKGAKHMVPLTHSKQCNFHLINFIKGLQ